MPGNPLNYIPNRVLEGALIFFGFIAMLTPLALWITWSNFTFAVVLGTGGIALTAFVLLSWHFNTRSKTQSQE